MSEGASLTPSDLPVRPVYSTSLPLPDRSPHVPKRFPSPCARRDARVCVRAARPTEHRIRRAAGYDPRGSDDQESPRPRRHRPLEPHRRRRAVGRRQVDDVHLLAERGRRHAVRPPARRREDATRFPSARARVFSDDSRYVGYFVSPPSAAVGRGGRRRRRSWRPGGAAPFAAAASAASSCSISRRGDKYRRARRRDVQVL